MKNYNPNSLQAIKDANAKLIANTLKNEVGKIYPTMHWGDIKVIGGTKAKCLIVQFLDSGNIKENVALYNIRKGKVSDDKARANKPSIFGVGYGPVEHNDNPEIYKVWQNILARCYCPKRFLHRDSSYKDCYVSDEWLHYDNFKHWYLKHRKPGVELFIDKDLLSKNNLLYSSKTCELLPREINNVLVRKYQPKERKTKVAVGIEIVPPSKWRPQIRYSVIFRNKHYGIYNDVNNAKKAYKALKEQSVRDMADKYRDVLSDRAYKALKNYKVKLEEIYETNNQ